MNGGYPAFAETQGAVLHPLVILTTLFWGVVNGTKLLLLCSLILAGIAQWWLAYVMGLGRAARIWASLVVVVSGSLIGKMDGGGFVFVLSQASASLIFAPIVGLYLHRKRSYIAWLGVLLALTWVSGQGYIQVGVVMAVFPMLLILILTKDGKISPLWKDYAMALVISLLLAGVFLVPMLHFYPSFTKVADPYLTNLQRLASLPLNLVINDRAYFVTENLGHDLMLYINYIFIGWIPVILAMLAMYFVPKEKSRLMWFFWAVILSVFVTCSLEYVSFLHKYFLSVDTLRYFSVISGLVVTPLLALAAWSLDVILNKPLPRLTLGNSDNPSTGFSLKWVLWIAILLTSVVPLTSNRLPWLDVAAVDYKNNLIQNIKTLQASWLAPIREDFLSVSILLHNGIKMTNVYRPWEWMDNPDPFPSYSFVYSQDGNQLPNEIGRDGDLRLIKDPIVNYASITNGTKTTPCRATSLGGNIDVSCITSSAGTLTVQENYFPGWNLWTDGKKQDLVISGQYLTSDAPAGSHHFQFRYQPLDVLAGFLFTLLGIGIIIWLFIQGEDDSKTG
jgi:hypothetical protein